MKHRERRGEQILQDIFGTATRAAAFSRNQTLTFLNPLMEQFIQGQEMMFIATADARGQCDCSFRAGSAGFVRVVNSKTLLYPEYRGNGVLASLGNITENPHIGLIFVDFFQTTIGLHVNGTARVLAPEAIREMPDVSTHLPPPEDTSGGRQPVCWVLIEVEEAYIHCSKHVPLLQKLDKEIRWGTDDETVKGGDFFRVKASARPTVERTPTPTRDPAP